MRLIFTGLSLLALLAANFWPVAVLAQEDEAAPKAGAAKAAPKKASGKAKPEEAAAPAALPKEKEKSPFLFEPKTPEELIDAIVQMVDLSRPALARTYLERLIESDLPDDAVLQLRDKYGGALFLKLLNVQELRPPIINLVDRMNRLSNKRAREASYINGLIEKLKGPPEERASAIIDLETGGASALPFLLQTIQSEDRKVDQNLITEIIAKMGARAVPGLIAALDTSDIRLRSHVATMLGNSADQRAVPALWYPAYAEAEAAPVRMAARMSLARLLKLRPSEMDNLSGSDAAARLQKLATSHFRREVTWPTEEDGKIEVWQWNSRSRMITPARMTPQEASDVQGLRFARAALNLTPEVRQSQVEFLALALSRDLRGLAWNEPYRSGPGTAFDLALTSGPDVVGDVVQYSLQSGRPLTAVVALKVLEQIGTASQLRGNAARGTPFLQALNYPDQRVQFAAAGAILQVDPSSSFLGAARVVSVLQRSISSDVHPRAIIARSNAELASVTGGMFGQMGYAPEVVLTGKECFKAATERLDVQLIVLHPSIVDWPLVQTLANLRADARTATIPVIIYGSPNAFTDFDEQFLITLFGKKKLEAKGDIAAKVRAVAQSFPLTTFILESQTREQLEQQVHPFLAQLQTPPLTEPQRAAMKAQAVGWMAHIATGRRQKVFNLAGSEEALTAAVMDPNLANDAVQALGEIATPVAQKHLADLTLNSSLDAKLRETVTNKLAFHIQRFGLLVSKETVDKLQTAQSAAAEPGLQSAFSILVGTLRPSAKLVGERLRAYDVTAGSPE